MPYYILLAHWTEQGIKNARKTLQRVEAARDLELRLEVRLKQIYWTAGPYDIVAIVEAPDDKNVTAFVLEVGSGGSVRTTTMRAYDADEMSEIVKKLD